MVEDAYLHLLPAAILKAYFLAVDFYNPGLGFLPEGFSFQRLVGGRLLLPLLPLPGFLSNGFGHLRVEIHSGRAELVKRELIARRCEWQQFAGLVWAAMRRVGIQEGDRVIALADGAEGLESIFDWVAPEAQRIRDFYHVAERIQAVGELRFGAGSPEAQRWIRLRLHQLKASELTTVMRSISHLRFDSQPAEHTRAQVLGYLEKHRAAMNYRDFHEKALDCQEANVVASFRRRWKRGVA